MICLIWRQFFIYFTFYSGNIFLTKHACLCVCEEQITGFGLAALIDSRKHRLWHIAYIHRDMTTSWRMCHGYSAKWITLRPHIDMMNRANRLYIKRVSVLSRQICICCTWLLVGLIYNKRKLSSPNTYQHARTEDCIVDTKQTAVQKGVKGRQTCRRIADKKKKKVKTQNQTT